MEYYLLQGVDLFYVLDNKSTDDTVERLRPYIGSGLVMLIPITEKLSYERFEKNDEGCNAVEDSPLLMGEYARAIRERLGMPPCDQ